MQKLFGAGHVARHLGVTKLTVLNWVDRPTAAFPMPEDTFYDVPGRFEGQPVWSERQLSELRTWLSARLMHSPDQAIRHWRQVDEGNAPQVPQGQEKFFEV